MQINYDFPWYLQNSEGFMALYTGLYNTATTISPITLLDALDIDNVLYPNQLKFVATLYGLRGDWVGIEQALIYDVNKWSGRPEIPTGEGTQVEYIEMAKVNNTPTFLITDIVPQSNYKIEVNFVINSNTSTTTGPVCGCDTIGVSTFGLITPIINNTRYFKVYGFGPGNSDPAAGYTSTVEVIPNEDYKFVWDNGTATLYSGSTVLFSHAFTQPGTMALPLGINAVKDTDAIGTNNDTYSYKRISIWDGNGSLVANYVPCVKDDVVGFYDTVTGVLKTASNGTFVAGPVVPRGDFEENYWSGMPSDSADLLKNYIKAKVQIRNKNLSLQALKDFFAVCLAHREFNPDTDIEVTESTLHFDLTITVSANVLNDMVTLLSVDPYPFGKPTGISYTITYVQE